MRSLPEMYMLCRAQIKISVCWKVTHRSIFGTVLNSEIFEPICCKIKLQKFRLNYLVPNLHVGVTSRFQWIKFLAFWQWSWLLTHASKITLLFGHLNFSHIFLLNLPWDSNQKVGPAWMLSARFVSNCRNIFPFLVKPFTSMPAETNILSLQRNLWMSSLLSRFLKIIFRFSYLSVPIAPPSSSLLTGVPGRVLKANAASPLFILKTCRTMMQNSNFQSARDTG